MKYHDPADIIDTIDVLALIDSLDDPEQADSALAHLGFEDAAHPLYVRAHAFVAFSDRLWMPGFPRYAIAFAVAICPLPVTEADGQSGRFDPDTFLELMRTGRAARLDLHCSDRAASLLEMHPLPSSVADFAARFGAGIKRGDILSVQTSGVNVYLWPLVGEPHSPVSHA